MEYTFTDAHVQHAGLQEIFSSIQGEGPWLGVRQVFVRFNACHLACQYCDTPQRRPNLPCQIEPHSGSGKMITLPNPVSTTTVMEWLQHFLSQASHHSLSLTGGEPLLYTPFLKTLLPQLVSLLPIYLESSGTQPDKLIEILPWLTYIAMDIKVPSATGEPMQVENHQLFYQLSRQKQMFIKLVVCDSTTPEELEPLGVIVTDKTMPIILQPMTDLKTGHNMVSTKTIFNLYEYLQSQFEVVRVIPQTHKMLSLL